MDRFQNIIKLFNLQEYNGIPEESILLAVEKWGNLPAVLIDFYRTLGAETNVCYICDELLQPEELYEIEGHLCFYKGTQGAISFCIKIEDTATENPPVFYKNTYSPDFVPVCDSLLQFLYGISCMQAINEGLEFNSEGFYPADEDLLLTISKTFEKKDFYLNNIPQINFYSLHDDDILAVLSDCDGAQVGYASSNMTHFEEIDSIITKYL